VRVIFKILKGGGARRGVLGEGGARLGLSDTAHLGQFSQVPFGSDVFFHMIFVERSVHAIIDVSDLILTKAAGVNCRGQDDTGVFFIGLAVVKSANCGYKFTFFEDFFHFSFSMCHGDSANHPISSYYIICCMTQQVIF